MTTVYLVRHCESQSNEKAVLAGHVDFDISEKGALQLTYLAERFRDVKLDIIYSSPLMRAYKTALAVNKYPQVPVIKDERLIEKYIGELEGKPFSYMTPEEEYCWRHMPHLFIPRGGESQQEVGARAYAALMDLVEKNRGKVIVLAAHGGFFRSLLCILRKIPWERMIEVPEPNNTCVNLVHFYDDGSWEIIYENDTSHLPAAAAAVPVSNWK